MKITYTNLWVGLLVCLAVACPPLMATPTQVFILAGQSNMVGTGKTYDLPTTPFDYTAPQPVLFNYGLSIDPELFVSDGWEQLRPSVRGDNFGLEITFGRTMDEALDEVAIIKLAVNGSNLETDWNPDATQGPMLYQRLLGQIDDALALFDQQNTEYEIAGFLWTQGEGDAAISKAHLYEGRLTDFIATLRTDLGLPELDVYLSRLSNRTNFSGKDGIRQGQTNVAKADPHVLAVDTDHLALQHDLVHFTSLSQMSLGEAFANAVLFGAPDEDFDGDGLVSDNDLNLAVMNWNHVVPAGNPGGVDIDGDGYVGQDDLKLIVDLIAPPPPLLGPADLNNDGYVGIEDLTKMLSAWNTQVLPGDLSQGDTNGDGFIGVADLTQLLSQWNTVVIDDRPPPPTVNEMDLDASGGLGIGDLAFLLANWSFIDESEPDVPDGSVEDPAPGDFNADGHIDIEDLRYLLEALPAGNKLGPADLNADGFVGIEDLTIVLGNWNQSASAGDASAGDVTADGFVGIEDLNAILGNWNTGTPPTGGAAVPEPGSGCVLLGMVCAGLCISRPPGKPAH